MSQPYLPELFVVIIISHHRQGKCDVDVSFHHILCRHHMALQTMRHVNDVVPSVLYLFYFLALPFSYPFYLTFAYFSQKLPFCKQKFYFLFPPRFLTQVGYFCVRLDIQQLLLGITFTGQFFRPFFFFGDFTHTADIGTGSNWNQTTNNQVFVDTNQFIG